MKREEGTLCKKTVCEIFEDEVEPQRPCISRSTRYRIFRIFVNLSRERPWLGRAQPTRPTRPTRPSFCEISKFEI